MVTWLGPELLLVIHARQIAEHGGPGGVRDESLLLSALAWPQQLHAYGDPAPDLADLAAALAHGIVRNHPFVDGNKRTAHVAYRTFLALNGTDLVATDEEKYVVVLKLADGSLKERAFAAWLRGRLRAAPPGAVHDAAPAYRRARGRRRPAARKATAAARPR